MKITELEVIESYWKKKYPNVDILLIEDTNKKSFCGKISSADNSLFLRADTIGKLISQGEVFLRGIKK